MADPVEVYSSGVLVSSGTLSEEQELEQGGCNSMFVRSGGTAVETVINEGTFLTADSGAEIIGINIEDGGLLSATDAHCIGAARWYGPVACATSGDIILSGGTYTGNKATDLNDALGFGGAVEVFAGSLSITGGSYARNSATGGGGAVYVNGSAMIDGAEFSANSATYGGAVEMAHPGSMTIVNAVFAGNSAEFGGGFENHQGASTTITDTIFNGNTATSGGAVLNDNYQLEKCYLTVNNVTFTGNTAEQGGAIRNDGVLVVSGGRFTENEAEEGKGGALCNVGTATVTDAEFTSNTGLYGGAVWQGNKKLTLNGNAFTGNTAIYGGALYANTSGSTVISGGAFTGNAAPYDEDYELGGMGGALYIAGGATMTITGTLFSDNSAEVNPANEWDGGCGGAVINYGELTVSGGEFAGNRAYYGGALYNQTPYPAGGPADGTMTITDTDFTDNVAEWGGGAICNCYGTLTVTGGEYTGNVVTGANSRDGGAIANWSEADITGAVFTGNTAAKGGALSHTGTTLTVTDAVFGSNAADEGGAFWSLNEWGDSVAEFVNCSFTGNLAEEGGAIWNGETLTVSGGEFTDNAADDGKGGALYNAGAATVDMAVFTGNTAIYGGAMYHSGGTLEVKDTYLGSNTGIYGGALYANCSGATVISAVSFEGNSASYDDDYELGGMGGALYIAGAATVTIADTIFDGNYAEVNPANEWDGGCGGAVINYGELTVSGGAFAWNRAYYGGALYNQTPYPAGSPTDGTMTITDTDFSGNVAEWGGGAICNCYGTLTVTGGNFAGNQVTGGNGRDGGAIANWSEATITGANFSGNAAVTGGALSNTGTTLTVTDSFLSGNSAGEGGAFWSLNEWSDSVAEFVNCTITENSADEGGAIWNGETLTISGGAFTNNLAADGKGGALYNVGTATVADAEFSDNCALMGGAIWQGAGELGIADTNLGYNTAVYGGALYANVSGSTVISGGAFTNNAARYDDDYEKGGMGGALYIAGAATVTIADTVFENNLAEVNPDNEWDGGCGGAVINYGELTVSGGEFAGNSAYYGGALYNQTPYPAGGENDGTMTVTDTDFTDNVAEWGGGAICNCYGTLTVTGGEYSGNQVTGDNGRDGGAIANWSEATITGASFTGNVAVSGGALSNTGTTLTVTDTTLSGNSAGEGGAFWSLNEWGDSVAVFVNCTFSGNTATQGGAIWNGETLYLSGCDFTTATDTIYNAGTITVTAATTFGAEVVNADGAAFTVSLADFTTATAAAVGGWSFIAGGEIRLAAFSEMAAGVYNVATGVGEWSGDIALFVDDASTGLAFTLDGGAVTSGTAGYLDRTYTLANDGGALTLTISGEAAAGPRADLLSNGCSQIVGWDPEQGKVGFVATDGNAGPAWRGVWEWSGEEAAMWKVVGVGHFSGSTVDHDGILLYNGFGNTFAAWTDLNDPSYGYVSLCHVDDNFQTRTLTDLDGDEFDDVLIYNEAGSFGVVLDAAEYHDIWHVDDPAANVWQLIGAGNFGAADGKDSLLVKNTGENAYFLWHNEDPTFTTWNWSQTYIGSLDDDWSVAGIGDFSGDGVDDIAMWRASTGEIQIWENADPSHQRYAGSVAQADWEVAAVGDYNGDGQEDLLLREQFTGWGGLGYWASADATKWSDLNARVETNMESKFAIIA